MKLTALPCSVHRPQPDGVAVGAAAPPDTDARLRVDGGGEPGHSPFRLRGRISGVRGSIWAGSVMWRSRMAKACLLASTSKMDESRSHPPRRTRAASKAPEDQQRGQPLGGRTACCRASWHPRRCSDSGGVASFGLMRRQVARHGRGLPTGGEVSGNQPGRDRRGRSLRSRQRPILLQGGRQRRGWRKTSPQRRARAPPGV